MSNQRLQVNYLFQEIPLARQYSLCADLGSLYHLLNRLGCPRLVGSNMQPTLGAECEFLILSCGLSRKILCGSLKNLKANCLVILSIRFGPACVNYVPVDYFPLFF